MDVHDQLRKLIGVSKTIPTVPINSDTGLHKCFHVISLPRLAGLIFFSQHSSFPCFLIYKVGILSATSSTLEKVLQIIDSSNSIWSAHLGKNKAASCVFTWASKWDRVHLSRGHGLGPEQNHFQVSGHRTMQDDLFKEESFKGLKEIKHVYFPSNYTCAFPCKIVPVPCLEEKPDFSMNLCFEGIQRGMVFF